MSDLPAGASDLVAAAILILGPDGEVLQTNKTCTDWLGAPVRMFWELVPRGEVIVPFRARLFPLRVEAELPNQRRRVAWTLQPYQSGQPIELVVATGVDVTQYRAVEDHHERLRTLIAAMPDAVSLKDGDGRWIEVNDAALALFQLTGVDYHGKTDEDLSHLPGWSPLRHALRYCGFSDQQAWTIGTLSRSEEIVPQPDGSARTFDVYKVPLFHSDGRRKSLVVLGRDVTDRARAEAQLRLVVDTVPELIAVLDREGVIVFVNLAIERFYGVPPEAVIGQRLTLPGWRIETVRGEPFPEEQLFFRRAQREGMVLGVELAVVGPAGQRHVLLVNAALLNDPSGSVVVVARDVTERSNLERMKSDFLKIVSHELRTPLTPLRLLVEQSRQCLAEGVPVEPNPIERMLRLIGRLEHLLGELFRTAQIEGGFKSRARSVVDLRAITANVVGDFRLRSPQRAITLEMPDVAARVEVDSDAIAEAIHNLLDNALKYSDGAIEVRLEQQPHHARVTLTDHGSGIPPEHRVGLFDRFYRISSDATIRQPGLGLGLFISRELVQQNRGEISFVTQEGKGSTFSIRLPLVDC